MTFTFQNAREQFAAGLVVVRNQDRMGWQRGGIREKNNRILCHIGRPILSWIGGCPIAAKSFVSLVGGGLEWRDHYRGTSTFSSLQRVPPPRGSSRPPMGQYLRAPTEPSPRSS